MNTGTVLETKRLLLTSPTEEDNEAFLKMLREDGDFELYCGMELSEELLMWYKGYLMQKNASLYSIVQKEDSNHEFVGYVGIAYHMEGQRYEAEYYVGRLFRGQGYCTEALRKVMDVLFAEGLSVDGKRILLEEIDATTFERNVPSLRVLERVGFKKHPNSPAGMWRIHENSDGFVGFTEKIVERVLSKEGMIE